MQRTIVKSSDDRLVRDMKCGSKESGSAGNGAIAYRSVTVLKKALLLVLCLKLLAVAAIAQQSPWSRIAVTLANEFTGPIARGFSLVAIVLGGLTLAFSDGGGKRAIGSLVFGLGMALGATQMLTWLFV